MVYLLNYFEVRIFSVSRNNCQGDMRLKHNPSELSDREVIPTQIEGFINGKKNDNLVIDKILKVRRIAVKYNFLSCKKIDMQILYLRLVGSHEEIFSFFDNATVICAE